MTPHLHPELLRVRRMFEASVEAGLLSPLTVTEMRNWFQVQLATAELVRDVPLLARAKEQEAA